MNDGADRERMMNEPIAVNARPRQAIGGRLVVGLVALAFLAGFALMGYAMWQWKPFDATTQSATDNGAEGSLSVVDPALAPPRAPAEAAPQGISSAASSLTLDAQSARMAELEQRIARVSIAAEGAAGNARRAEGMMMAFAARRALDSGQPLGYVEQQIRLRFGAAQPKAVATIMNAAAEPVTLPELRAGLETILTSHSNGAQDRNWWESASQAIRTLVIIREADQPSSLPSERIASARIHVEAGMIDAAIEDVLALGPSQSANAWLEKARRYNEARRALDLIEAAAMLESRAAVDTANGSATNRR